jgi:hypothetical protein
MRGLSTDWQDLAEQRGFSSPEEMLRTLYEVEGKTLEEMAGAFGVSLNVVRNALLRTDIERRSRGWLRGRTRGPCPEETKEKIRASLRSTFAEKQDVRGRFEVAKHLLKQGE